MDKRVFVDHYIQRKIRIPDGERNIVDPYTLCRIWIPDIENNILTL